MDTVSKTEQLPVASSQPQRSWSWLWILPILAAIGALLLVYTVFSQRGIPITIEFDHGHGLKAGDSLRYRGIEIGRVHEVRLSDDFQKIRVLARLDHSARDLARQGSRFWIVRPQVGIAGAAGLETLVGANYLSVLPGAGSYRSLFDGQETAPILETMAPGGLEIALRTPRKGSLRPGAPINYRQIVIGKILFVHLARDASTVEARVYVEPFFAHLVREEARFWKSGGARIDADLFSGLSLEIDSVQTLLTGGVTMAIPPDPGGPVARGHRFELFDKPKRDWLEWSPNIALDEARLLTQPQRPKPVRARLHWKSDSYLMPWRGGERDGWILPVETGYLGPGNLLSLPAGAEPGSLRLEVEEEALALLEPATAITVDLALLPHHHELPTWPRSRRRTTQDPEDTLIITDSNTATRFVAGSQYQANNGYWKLETERSPALQFAPAWHGASVVAANDGNLLGILLIDEDSVRVALLPRESEKKPSADR